LHAGLVLLIAGAALLGGYWVFVLVSEVLGDPGAPLAVRIGLPALGAGGLLLLAAVLIEQVRRNRREDFGEVEH
jgi:apolipoprotein N-acyltransferase